MKIGIVRERKSPPDSRVPLTPRQCAAAMKKHPVTIVVEASATRCYTDDEYRAEGIEITTDVTDCDLLLGVKEVPHRELISEKTYLIFSHTIKKQSYNQPLLRAVLDKDIRLIDYEMLKDEAGQRLLAFGHFAGMVGAHNALWTYAQRTGTFKLPRMKDFHDYRAAKEYYLITEFPAVKIVLTGTGRVSSGAAEVLHDMGIQEVKPSDFLQKTYDHAVFTQLDCRHYVSRKDQENFEKRDFYRHPERYKSIFYPYTRVADIFINGIFWDNRAPQFFTLADMKKKDFRIQVIADVTCDIAPESSIPSTLRPSSIADPVYGFHPATSGEIPPYQPHSIDVMAIDNLPNELPRDASESFGHQLFTYILPEILQPHSHILERATIAEKGHLTRWFQYLEDYAASSQEQPV